MAAVVDLEDTCSDGTRNSGRSWHSAARFSGLVLAPPWFK